jgi:hypothetical protein
VDVCLYPFADIPEESQCLKKIIITSRKMGIVILQEHANQERILDLINMLEQA